MQTPASLQWGGRFSAPPDAALLEFGSSLAEDLVLAPFDVACSHAHVIALERGGIISGERATALQAALNIVSNEILDGSFRTFALDSKAEDIHGAIDQRVCEHCPDGNGEWLHAGRSRNDQVATTLLLYVRDRARSGRGLCVSLATELLRRAREELTAQTVVAGVTHWQPAQPVLLAFWLCAAAQMLLRGAHRFAQVEEDARRSCPLGSGAVSGSTLPLARSAASQALEFDAPSRNAMDAIGTRDSALDLLHAVSRALSDAARVCNELILWSAPAFGYVRLGDAASTGSSLMPQKRNPDPFELVRAWAARVNAAYSGAVATLGALGLSYHRDLQQTKALVLAGTEKGLQALQAFGAALKHVEFLREAMEKTAGSGYTVATDVADALIAAGVSPKRAHCLVGEAVSAAESQERPLQAADISQVSKAAGVAITDIALEPLGSIRAKRTIGSTHPDEVLAAIEAAQSELDELQ